MKKSRYSEAQIVSTLKEAENGGLPEEQTQQDKQRLEAFLKLFLSEVV